MHSSSYRHSSIARPPSRLGLVCDDPDDPPRDASTRLLRQMLRRGSGYGIAGPTWREGKRQRPAARPRDVKAAARTLTKRLRSHIALSERVGRVRRASPRNLIATPTGTAGTARSGEEPCQDAAS